MAAELLLAISLQWPSILGRGGCDATSAEPDLYVPSSVGGGGSVSSPQLIFIVSCVTKAETKAQVWSVYDDTGAPHLRFFFQQVAGWQLAM